MAKLHALDSPRNISNRDSTRARIIESAIELLNKGGREAVTTRAVGQAAAVQTPTIYRIFADMKALLDAVAEHGFTTYLAEKTSRKVGKDPIADLRTGWDLHVEFGLANPAIYMLMYAQPQSGFKSSAAERSHRILTEHIRRVAAIGRLRVSEERAADLFHASGCGTVLTLLSKENRRRDMKLSPLAREAAIAAITTGSPVIESLDAASAAIALRAVLPNGVLLSEAERSMLCEWLDRLADR